MADFSTLGGSEIKIESFGEDLTTSLGTVVAPNATAHTKGAWVELIASTNFDYESFQIVIRKVSGVDYLVDLGIGSSGNEEVIVSNFPVMPNVNTQQMMTQYDFPVNIPTGSRIAVRCQASFASAGTLNITGQGLSGSFNRSTGLSKVVDYGTNISTTNLTPVDAGAVANTKGSWIEIVAATSKDSKGIFLCTGTNSNFSLSTAGFFIDIGIGAAASEQIIVPNAHILTHSTLDASIPNVRYYPMQIPDGTRITARMQSSTTDATDRILSICILGVV